MLSWIWKKLLRIRNDFPRESGTLRIRNNWRTTSDEVFPFDVGVSTRHFRGTTGDFNRRRPSWWSEIPVPRFCVFTDWLKADVHCFPRALIGWNSATAGKPSTFLLALFLQHLILICWSFFALSVFRTTAFYPRWIMIQRIEVFIRKVSVLWTTGPDVYFHVKMKNTVLFTGSRIVPWNLHELALTCMSRLATLWQVDASQRKSNLHGLASTCVPFGQALMLHWSTSCNTTLAGNAHNTTGATCNVKLLCDRLQENVACMSPQL